MKKLFIKITISMLSCFLIFSSMQAQQNTLEMTDIIAIGEGVTRDEAVKSALIEVINQVDGIAIESKTSLLIMAEEWSIGQDSSSAYKESFAKSIKSKSKGFISGYKILEAYCSDSCEVKVLATVKKYTPPGINPNSRRSLAVMPFSFEESSYNTGGRSFSAEEIAEKLTHATTGALTQTRKFSVLDRKYNEIFKDEKHLVAGQDFKKEEITRFGQALGADYLLAGKILDFNIDIEEQTSSLTGQRNIVKRQQGIVQFTIFATATRQIKWSDTVTIDSEATLPEIPINSDSLIKNLVSEVGTQISFELLNNIYPTRVAAIGKDGNVVLNMGGSNFKVGSVYSVYSLGQEVIDQYTGERLGKAEEHTADIEITRVLPKQSYAVVISKKGSVSKGMIVRPKTSVEKSSGGGHKEGDVKINNSGGVVLPFD